METNQVEQPSRNGKSPASSQDKVDRWYRGKPPSGNWYYATGPGKVPHTRRLYAFVCKEEMEYWNKQYLSTGHLYHITKTQLRHWYAPSEIRKSWNEWPNTVSCHPDLIDRLADVTAEIKMLQKERRELTKIAKRRQEVWKWKFEP